MKFTMMIPAALTKSRTIQKTVGRPSKRKSDGDLPLERRKESAPIPAPVPAPAPVPDNVPHWPEFLKKKNKCRFCKTGAGRVYCTKCDMCLCLSNSRNCFVAYHSK